MKDDERVERGEFESLSVHDSFKGTSNTVPDKWTTCPHCKVAFIYNWWSRSDELDSTKFTENIRRTCPMCHKPWTDKKFEVTTYTLKKPVFNRVGSIEEPSPSTLAILELEADEILLEDKRLQEKTKKKGGH